MDLVASHIDASPPESRKSVPAIEVAASPTGLLAAPSGMASVAEHLVMSPTDASLPEPSSIFKAAEDATALAAAPSISADATASSKSSRPRLVKHVSTPSHSSSPLRHHQKKSSAPRHVKESLDAHSEYITSKDDGSAQHRINQYIIKQEIGRGSFGAVHLAVDKQGQEYAVKEFSKSRLRKRAQSHFLRRPRSERRPGQLAAGKSFNSPLHRDFSPDGPSGEKSGSGIDLIMEEIAIMKKLNHTNLVSLYEVLDDPTEDSLYMVMEMCKKGVVMKVGMDERSDPYPDENCRCWFRDLILAVEYLHAQGVVHRDIKPDNCLLTEDDVLKVVDFGVSEMFEKDSDMRTAKPAGSPAFLPPELCVVKHGDISGKAADIWSMGVTLYCLKYGRIPFEKSAILEMYECIKSDEPVIEEDSGEDFIDLMHKVLEKDPAKRIKMQELRKHPWVTKGGTDPLLSEEENTSEIVQAPTEEEMNDAITGNITNLLTVVRAVGKFKSIIENVRPSGLSSILGENDSDRFSQPPLSLKGEPSSPQQRPPPPRPQKSHSLDTYDRHPVKGPLASEGVHREIHLDAKEAEKKTNSGSGQDRGDTAIPKGGETEGAQTKTTGSSPTLSNNVSTESSGTLSRVSTEGKLPAFRPRPGRAKTFNESGHKGQAHDPLEDQLYLYIGPSTFSTSIELGSDRRSNFVPEDEDVPVVSESPGAAEIDVYETAYRDEIERIQARLGIDISEEPTVYLNRRIDAKLMALGEMAGQVAAIGVGGLERIGSAVGFAEGKAKVGGVSKALRQAAKEEYKKRREERKKGVVDTAEQTVTTGLIDPTTQVGGSVLGQVGVVSEEAAKDDEDESTHHSKLSQRLGEVGHGGGGHAKTSLMGIVDMMKKDKGKKATAEEIEEL